MDWAVTAPVLGALSTAPDWSSITSVIASLGALAGVVYVGSRTRKSTQEANDTARESTAVATAQALWARVDEVDQARKKDRKDWEDERDELRRKQDETASILSVSIDFIERLFRWGRDGGGEPEPTIPVRLHDRLAHLITDHHQEG